MAVAAGALSACGSSTPSTAQSGGAPVTRAQAAAYAAAINLKASDMTGLTVGKPESEHVVPTPSSEELARCAGEVDPATLILDRDSPTFVGVVNGEHELISSGVEVLPSAAVAKQHFVAQDAQRAITCLRRRIPHELAAQDGARVHFGQVDVTRLPDRAKIPNSEAIRVSVPILGVPNAIARNPVYYIDALVFISDSAEVALTATAFPRPVPSSAEQAILTLLYHRATANRLQN